jgi:hypothetical protein
MYTSMIDGMKLEVLGAERRLALAETALADFTAEHEGKEVPRELARSLERERNLLETELDSARRRYEESARQLSEALDADRRAFDPARRG